MPFRRHHDHDSGHDHGFGGPARGHHHGFPGDPTARLRQFGAGFGPGFGGPQRKRRGDVRLAILSLLKEKPANGYGLIKLIGERTDGAWTPSPGSVYPTLQQLVDEGLIEATGEGQRTEFQLTDAGTAYVEEHSDELAGLWAATDKQAARDAGLGESTGKLMAAVGQLRFGGSEDQRARAKAVLDEARKSIYAILAE
jgi:DNA-binding PadR family transcriptional regulator